MTERLVTDIGGFEAGEVPKEERPPLFRQRQLMAVFSQPTPSGCPNNSSPIW